MKKIFLVALMLVLTAPAIASHKKNKASEDTDNTITTTDSGLYWGLGTGADLPGSNWSPDYYVGGGADVFGGYRLDKNWAGQLDAQEWFLVGGGNSLLNFRVLAEAKYTFEGQGWQPYLLAGGGPVFQSLSPAGDSTTNFDALGGLGIQFDLAPKTHLFLEAKYNFILSQTTTFTDLPVNAGLWVEL